MMSGCSLMPYKSEFSCERGKNSGICDSVSNNYKFINEKKRSVSIAEQDTHETYIEGVSISFDHCYEKIGRSTCAVESCKKIDKGILEKCIEDTKKDFLTAHNLSFRTINQLLSYQHLENERLRQKLELEYGANHE